MLSSILNFKYKYNLEILVTLGNCIRGDEILLTESINYEYTFKINYTRS